MYINHITLLLVRKTLGSIYHCLIELFAKIDDLLIQKKYIGRYLSLCNYLFFVLDIKVKQYI